MSFAVVWEPRAAEKVDEGWASASPPQQLLIEKALGQISNSLRDDPLTAGESRKADFDRVFTAPPVTVYYRVIERLNLVRVFAARVYQQP